MKPRVLTGILALGIVFDTMACASCTADRLRLEGWHFKYYFLNVGMALLFTANRLDCVRVFNVMGIYALFMVKAFDFLLFNAFPYPDPPPWKYLTSTAAWCVWNLNLIGIAILFVLSRFRFFRRNKEQGLRFWQPPAYASAVFLGDYLIY
jgi:hypothetical protein